MAPSPSEGSSKNRSLIRELSESLNRTRGSLPMPTSPARESATNSLPAGTLLELSASSFNPENEDVLQSTRQLDDTTDQFPKIRSTAQKYKYWRPPPPEQNVDTSTVRKHFTDFSDYDYHSHSIEMGRAPRDSLRDTPSKINMSQPSIGKDSLYGLSPQPRQRATPRKTGEAAPRDSLRRDAALRRANSLPQKELEGMSSRSGKNSPRLSPNKQTANIERRRSTLAQMHNQIAAEEDDSYIDERPPTVTFTTRNARFSNPRSRQTSGATNDASFMGSTTPQRPFNGTPRSAAPFPGNGTQQSFMLPDLPNLTELVSGQWKDGTPVFSRSSRARSRFASQPIPYRSNDEPPHAPVEDVPVPEDEKAILASLQLLKERLSQVEQEKAEADKRIEEFEDEVGELKAELDVQKRGRSDSALGSTDGESAKSNWRVDKTKLESRVESLRTRAERAERKVSVADIATKRVTQERDNLVTQLGVAFFNCEELKGEREVLQNENDTLREEVDGLRAENNELRVQLARFEDQTQRFQEDAMRGDNVVRKENETLRLQLEQAEATQADNYQLQDLTEGLKAQVAALKKKGEEDARKRVRKETELRSRIDARDETIQQLQNMTQQSETDQTFMKTNQDLRAKVDQLKRECEQREKALREAQDMTNELVKLGLAKPEDSFLEQRPSGRRSEKNTQGRAPRKAVENVETGKPATANRPTATRNVQDKPSKLASKSAPAFLPTRSSSAPEVANVHTAGDLNDVESTTDLTLSWTGVQPKNGAASGPSNDQAQEPTGDLTFLSDMSPNVIAQLRKTIEEERAANRRKATASAPPTQQQDDTVGSRSRARSLTEKDLTTGSRPMDITENVTGRVISVTPQESFLPKQDTQRSIQSNTSTRRRRSAPADRTGPVDTTSAFILPDITIKALDALKADANAKPHQGDNCTVCQPEPASIKAPAPIPVSDRTPQDDPDVTMRPSQPPPLALAAVIKALNDELAHLQIKKGAYDALLRRQDPSLGRRQRKSVEDKITHLLAAISTKSDQIYALYDVVEGQKEAGQLQGFEDEANGMDEREFENTLLSIGLDPEEMRERTASQPLPPQKSKGKAKKVVIDERGLDSESDEELPWEGISETESVLDFGRR